MSALAVRTIVDPGPSLPAPRRDAGLVPLAALGAVVLHAIAFAIPLPERTLPPPPVVGPSDPPEIIRTVRLPPPPPPPEPAATPPEPGIRLAPVPMPWPALVPADEPLSAVELQATLPVDPIVSTGEVAPPPVLPSVYDQATAGLVLPVPAGERATPVYPPMGRVAGRGGRVVLLATITERGTVEELEVLAAPTPELGFVQAAIDAVSTWRYTPGELRGRPVAVQMTVVVTFELD